MTPSPKPEDRLFEGDCCCLCGGAYSYCSSRSFYYCAACCAECHWNRYGSHEAVYAEIDRRVALAANPKPAVEMYGTQPSELPETLPAGTVSIGKHCPPTDMAGWMLSRVSQFANREYYPAVYEQPGAPSRWNPPEYVNWETVVKSATPPIAPAAEAKAGLCSWRNAITAKRCTLPAWHVGVCSHEEAAAEAKPEKRPDPDREEMALRDAQVALQQQTRDSNYRRRVQVDSLLRDMGRPMVRRDRMGRDLVPWVGWVSTFNARDSK